jgi:hypothetical protein
MGINLISRGTLLNFLIHLLNLNGYFSETFIQSRFFTGSEHHYFVVIFTFFLMINIILLKFLML